tara:strand:+ start:62 stop:223 length:162 start_codon:yes stop_codon:yes gene_type:complete
VAKPYQQYYVENDMEKRRTKAILQSMSKYQRETLLGRIVDNIYKIINKIKKRS